MYVHIRDVTFFIIFFIPGLFRLIVVLKIKMMQKL